MVVSISITTFDPGVTYRSMSMYLSLHLSRGNRETSRSRTDLEKSGRKIVVREKSWNFIFLLKVKFYIDFHTNLLFFLVIIENIG